MADDAVPRQTDAAELDPRSTGDLDIDDRQQNRQTATPGQHQIEHRVVRMVVSHLISAEPVGASEHLPARDDHRIRFPVRLRRGAG